MIIMVYGLIINMLIIIFCIGCTSSTSFGTYRLFNNLYCHFGLTYQGISANLVGTVLHVSAYAFLRLIACSAINVF